MANQVINVEIKGLDLLKKKLSKGERVTRQLVLQALFATADEWSRKAKKSIRTGRRSGRVNPRTGRKRSAPGEFPKQDTGNLAKNIGASRIRNGARLKSSAEYSAYLEFGTSTMDPRPYFQPTIKDNLGLIEKNTNEAVNRGLKNAGLI